MLKLFDELSPELKDAINSLGDIPIRISTKEAAATTAGFQELKMGGKTGYEFLMKLMDGIKAELDPKYHEEFADCVARLERIAEAARAKNSSGRGFVKPNW